jgi:hypothetical protein
MFVRHRQADDTLIQRAVANRARSLTRLNYAEFRDDALVEGDESLPSDCCEAKAAELDTPGAEQPLTPCTIPVKPRN